MKKQLIIPLLFFVFTVNAQKSVAIFWDASYSMLDKNIEKEVRLIDTLVSSFSISKVNLTVFANKVLSDTIINTSSEFKISNLVSDVNYDGSSNLPNLNNYHGYDYILCFTDLLNKDFNNEKLQKKLFVISSNGSNQMESFQANNLNYINLNTTSIVNAYSILKGEKVLIQKSLDDLNYDGKVKIFGKLHDEFGKMEGVVVTSLETGNSYKTDASGFYEIESFDGDLIQFTVDESILKTIQIYSKSDKKIDLNLSTNTNTLDEVVVNAEKKSELKVLGTTIEETRKLGYAVAQVNASDFTPADRTVGELVGKNVPGIRGQANNNLGSVVIRGFSSLQGNNHPIVFIDDIPVESSSRDVKADFGSFIDPNTIESVKVLKGVAATSIYGQQGTNGVILIYTKKGNFSGSNSGRKNVFNDKLVVRNIDESYLKIEEALSKGENLDQSYKIYLRERLKSNNQKNLIYYFNSSDYFDKNGGYEKALRILSNIVEVFPRNERELLALAYKYEQKHYNREALKVYKKLYELYPNSLQNKRNLANAYYKNKKLNESYDLYDELLNDQNIKLPQEFKKLVSNEFKHLYLKHKDDINKTNTPDILNNINNVADGRLVFEWNDSSSNFDLQFINPDKLYYNWQHNIVDSNERITEEQNFQYGSQEFLLLDAEKGDWYFNVKKPEGNTNVNDDNTFLKMTLYKNYGRSNEIKTTKIINLNFTEDFKTIAKIRIN